MLDAIATYNRDRWEALGKANALWTRPWLDLDAEEAHRRLDPDGWLGDLNGKTMLCLASGGGQQSAAFALLGAQVTVVDLTASQLARDAEAAQHYGLTVRTVQTDMRDLSMLEADTFDVVWHPYSLNFVPDCRRVFSEVARVLRPGGLYQVMTANPFVAGLGTHAWNGRGYELTQPYVDGGELTYPDEAWVLRDESTGQINRPREYRHILSTLLNGLADQGFVLWRTQEHTRSDPSATPGDWDHFRSVAPPWLLFWAIYRPDILLSRLDRGKEDPR